MTICQHTYKCIFALSATTSLNGGGSLNWGISAIRSVTGGERCSPPVMGSLLTLVTANKPRRGVLNMNRVCFVVFTCCYNRTCCAVQETDRRRCAVRRDSKDSKRKDLAKTAQGRFAKEEMKQTFAPSG